MRIATLKTFCVMAILHFPDGGQTTGHPGEERGVLSAKDRPNQAEALWFGGSHMLQRPSNFCLGFLMLIQANAIP